MAFGDLEPLLGLVAGAVRRSASLLGRPTLLCRDLLAPPGLSRGVLFGEPGALGKRVGSVAQRRGQPFSGLPGTPRRALGVARAVGGIALNRGFGSPIPCLVARFALTEPTEDLVIDHQLRRARYGC